MGSPLDAVRHNAIDPNASQRRGKDSEECGELRDHAPVQRKIINHLRQRSDIAHREIRIDLAYTLTDRGNNRGWIARISHNETAEELLTVLRIRKEGCRHLPLFQFHILRIFYHADHLDIL